MADGQLELMGNTENRGSGNDHRHEQLLGTHSA